MRYWVNRAVASTEWGRSFPWATFGVNLAGSFLLGLLVIGLAHRPGWRALLGVGVCGGFTTFSTFSVETVHLIESERYAAAVGYVSGSVLAGIVGAWLGMRFLR